MFLRKLKPGERNSKVRYTETRYDSLLAKFTGSPGPVNGYQEQGTASNEGDEGFKQDFFHVEI